MQCSASSCDSQPRMTIPRAAHIVAGRFKPLGEPGKIPGFSWGIPAFRCIRGAWLAEQPGIVCESCYARRGWYMARNVAKTQYARLEGLEHPLWAEAMTYLIGHCVSEHFRWFDSGDLQSTQHLAQIVEICRATPHVKHWLPTHEPCMVGLYLKSGGQIPDNLCIRISADYIESAPTTRTFGLPTSTVHRFKGEPVPIPGAPRKASIECSAYRRTAGYGRRITTSCGKCRACWDTRVQNVSYKKH